ncbi:progranulin-like [Echeneis naucrates]|uniref:Progranulin-like n=1 Tax=Echeneis naucrates TaxID=173247 RepID=A0A665U8P7_ECHNA|nr:progranulin-like [Echeneis naucrates]
MMMITLWLLVGMFVWDFGSSSITCPDGNICSDFETCCKTTHGYSCCPFPKAVCCPDMAHCCPQGFRCNMVTMMCEKENQPWMNIPMVNRETAVEPNSPVSFTDLKSNHDPNQKKVSVVHCDNYYTCPDGTTCCRHPKGAWFCCPYSLGRCCLDGFHCCPYGYDCDLTYTHCVRQSLRYPFTPKQALSSVPASLISPSEDKTSFQETPMTALTEASDSDPKVGVIRCDTKFYCPAGTTCCKGSTGWSCCPYPLGKCCADGQHCCQYGYTCSPTFKSCIKFSSQVASGVQEEAKTD